MRARAWMGAALAALTLACGGATDAPERGAAGLNAVATTTIVADLVRNVGGDDVTVVALMGPGIDPHLYKASAGDVRRMSSADIVFYNGHHLEGKMAELFEQIAGRGRKTVAVTSCVPEESLLEADGYAGLADPHLWFDVDAWRHAVRCVADALAEADPAHADGYRERAASYDAQLVQLHAWVVERLSGIPAGRRVLVTAHDAFSYFGRAYELEVRGLLGVSTASEAGTADVQELADFIAERRIPAIFIESSVSPRYVLALQQAVESRGFEVTIGGALYSDALGDQGTLAETYIGTVRENVETIARALEGGAG